MLEGLAEALEGDLAKHQALIFTTILECATYLPTKTPVYGALVGLLNSRQPTFGQRFVSRLQGALQEAFDGNEYQKLKLLVRFAGELVKGHALHMHSLFDLFEDMVSETAGEDGRGAGPSAVRQDAFAYIVMLTIPWCGRELAAAEDDTRAIQPFQSTSDNREDWLEIAWSRLLAWRDDGMGCKVILNPYKPFMNRLTVASPHLMPRIRVEGRRGRIQFFPPIALGLFEGRDQKREASPVEQTILDEYVGDILAAFAGSHRETAKQLAAIPVSFAYEHALVEGLLVHILRLPFPQHKIVYYSAVLVNLVKGASTISPVLCDAMDNLFERLPTLDAELSMRLAEWFAHHLSNVDFTWNWNVWSYALASGQHPSRRRFLQEVIERMVRLSYHERIEKTLPEEFLPLVPARPTPFPKYTITFQDAQSANEEGPAGAALEESSWKAACALFQEITEAMRSRLGADVFLSKLTKSEDSVLTSQQRLDVLLHAMFSLGSKSFSHMLAITERYVSVLQALTKDSAEPRTLVCRAVSSFWRNCKQQQVILLEKLMTYRVVDNSAIINHLFSDRSVPQMCSGHVWEILHNTISKTLARTAAVRADFQKAEEELASGSAADSSKQAPEIRVRQMRETLDAVLREQKAMFLILFQRFVLVLTDQIAQNGQGSAEEETEHLFSTILGFLKATGRRHAEELKPFLSTLQNLLFTSDVDTRIRDAFQAFASVISA
eukprot:tig00021589_g22732.t1